MSTGVFYLSAHEAGHALQDASSDLRLRLRRFLVPLLFGGMLIFQLTTLPVEINASRRALDSLERLGLSDPAQRVGVQKVLTAAAFTYIAAAATSLAYVLTLFARAAAASSSRYRVRG